jgi:hypothetical protein
MIKGGNALHRTACDPPLPSMRAQSPAPGIPMPP